MTRSNVKKQFSTNLLLVMKSNMEAKKLSSSSSGENFAFFTAFHHVAVDNIQGESKDQIRMLIYVEKHKR